MRNRFFVPMLALVAVACAPSLASAQANIMKECGAEYQSAKAANTLDGKNWQAFLSECRTRHAAATTTAPAAMPTAAPAPAPTVAPAPTTAAAPPAGVSPTSKTPASATAAKPVSGGRAAMLERERACGAEWRAQKVELRKATPGLKWPQYWSQCNARMKAAAK